MSKFKIVNLLDKLFISCAVFLIIYAWVNFYIRNLWITFIFSLIFSFAVLYLLNFIITKKQQSKSSKAKLEDEANKQFLIFCLNSKNKKLELLKQILQIEYQTTLSNYVLTFKKDNRLHLVIIATQYDCIDNNILFNILQDYELEEVDAINIICNTFNPSINQKILKNKEIVFITKKSLYNDYFCKHQIFPDSSNINLEKQKFNFKNFLYALFLPQKAKSYFVCGMILIFSSIILPYHFYYIIVGSMLLMFSIICKLLPKFKD